MTETLRLEPPQYSRNYGDDVDDGIPFTSFRFDWVVVTIWPHGTYDIDMGEFGGEEKPAVVPPAPVVEVSLTYPPTLLLLILNISMVIIINRVGLDSGAQSQVMTKNH
jgi:hypothetical protein